MQHPYLNKNIIIHIYSKLTDVKLFNKAEHKGFLKKRNKEICKGSSERKHKE